MKNGVLEVLVKLEHTDYKPTAIEEDIIRIELDSQIKLLDILYNWKSEFIFHVVYSIAIQSGFSHKTSMYLADNTTGEEAKRFLFKFIIDDILWLLETIGDKELYQQLVDEKDDDLYYGIFDGDKERLRKVYTELVKDRCSK